MELTSRLMIWQELAESCGITTLQQSLQQVWRLLLLCLICRVCFRLVVSSTVKHVMSMLTGMYGLFLFLELHMLWVLLLSIICYLSLVLCRHSSNKGLFLSAVILVYLLIGFRSKSYFSCSGLDYEGVGICAGTGDAPLRSAKAEKCFRLLVITALLTAGGRRAAASAHCLSSFSIVRLRVFNTVQV
ncbi:hypothetical protein AMECASPLE_015841 [Ameca splendens]|uniref:Uncharacterized protein n=1 Tax=Ameca splendens TaxID=208324 RepID=A0ABV0Y1X7_9TELE